VRLNAFAAFPAKTGIALDRFGGVVKEKSALATVASAFSPFLLSGQNSPFNLSHGCLLVPKRFAAVMFTTIAVRTCHNTQRTGLMSKYALRISLVA
jgi:hypothetical protein